MDNSVDGVDRYANIHPAADGMNMQIQADVTARHQKQYEGPAFIAGPSVFFLSFVIIPSPVIVEHVPVGLQVLQDPARADGHAGGGVLGHVAGDAGLLGDELIEAVELGAAAGEADAGLGDVAAMALRGSERA